jgi:hypothetical protein
MLSHFFNLTEVTLLARKPLSPLGSWVPQNGCSVTAAHYMRLTLGELAEAVKEFTALGIGSTPSSLKGLLNNTRFTFTETLCHLWQNGTCRCSSTRVHLTLASQMQSSSSCSKTGR